MIKILNIDIDKLLQRYDDLKDNTVASFSNKFIRKWYQSLLFKIRI